MEVINEALECQVGFELFEKFKLDLRSPYLKDNQDVVLIFLKRFKRILKDQVKRKGSGKYSASIKLQFDIESLYKINCMKYYKGLVKYISHVKINNDQDEYFSRLLQERKFDRYIIKVHYGDLYNISICPEFKEIK